ncbi:hypothetical protein PSAB6_70032 [Paraburkholderia sabiae]|nr:hypothetical protein PSAB6_70032 [Paraburkholderia sabiae]
MAPAGNGGRDRRKNGGHDDALPLNKNDSHLMGYAPMSQVFRKHALNPACCVPCLLMRLRQNVACKHLQNTNSSGIIRPRVNGNDSH